MTPDEHAAFAATYLARPLAPPDADTGVIVLALRALTHAVLSLRPAPLTMQRWDGLHPIGPEPQEE